MRAVLSIESGQGEPSTCPLHPDRPVTLGRHRNNLIVLQDEHASRWHAEIFAEDGKWFVRDFGALNGTRLNGQPVVQQAPLEDGSVIGIGKTELRFRIEAPAADDPKLTTPQGSPPAPSEEASSWIDELEKTSLRQDELGALCQFMAVASQIQDPGTLIQRALETVYRQTGAAIAGYLSLDSDHPLPKIVIPALAKVDIHLSRKLTQEVQRQKRLVWGSSRVPGLVDAESLLSFSDAICVPLLAGETPLGALHVYQSGKSFHERDAHFCEILAGHLANSLHVLRVHRQLAAENTRLRSHATVADELVGESPAMVALRQRIRMLAGRPTTVLVVGETGSGKELVALALHRLSSQREGPLVCANCAAITSALAESELFGHCKDAFTGASRDHPGFFQQADEGTLFLDEVGELSLDIQAKLLRIIEGRPFRPVGGTRDVAVKVRIIAATNRNLEQEVEGGRFRQDLFYRLQGIQIRVPPLREHLEDLPVLVNFFLRRLAAEWGRQVRLSTDALAYLREFPWPGNVRQLRLALENAVALTEKDVLEPSDFNLVGSQVEGELPSLNLEELEKMAIRQALRRTEGNVSQAARLLGIVRDTLAAKMKKYGIQRDDSSSR